MHNKRNKFRNEAQIYPVLMADVVGSRTMRGDRLAVYLDGVVKAANRAFSDRIFSPLTVTLGDEFQGVLKDVHTGVELILWLEHQLRASPLGQREQRQAISLRYVLHEGEIDTAVNRERAHGMLGPGLTKAREMLVERARGLHRMRIAVSDSNLCRRLDALFYVLDTLTQDWNVRDYSLIEAMLAEEDSERLAERFKRHRTSIDRRRKNLKIEAYQSIERLLLDLSAP